MVKNLIVTLIAGLFLLSPVFFSPALSRDVVKPHVHQFVVTEYSTEFSGDAVYQQQGKVVIKEGNEVGYLTLHATRIQCAICGKTPQECGEYFWHYPDPTPTPKPTPDWHKFPTKYRTPSNGVNDDPHNEFF